MNISFHFISFIYSFRQSRQGQKPLGYGTCHIAYANIDTELPYNSTKLSLMLNKIQDVKLQSSSCLYVHSMTLDTELPYNST
jgi:hypothetical protein